MKEEKISIAVQLIKEILANVPYKPFFCLPLSALLYANLKDNHNINTRFVTGNLLYKKGIIFKQDFSLSDARDGIYREWSGHAWVEMEDLIFDLSFFRTLYSDNFNKPM